MRIDVTIDYKKDGCSEGSAAGMAEEISYVWRFKVRLAGFAVHVEFIDPPETDEALFGLREKVKPLIVKEYLRLCMLKGGSPMPDEAPPDESQTQADVASRKRLLICVDGCAEGEIYGRLYTAYAEILFPFHDIPSLLLQMERIYDVIGYPRSATLHRRFRNEKKPHLEFNEKGISDLQKNYTLKPTGEIATFVVKVALRQNSSWQGTVTWVEEKKQQSFRSALELIRLIDSASADGGAKAVGDSLDKNTVALR